ncbi:hypothetical protein Glove_271g16 [Diversispora epigaea]|uniref:TLDc domain-containing protein n=1 Tax=Diversispora epigaea TaxID=1348612 RepID=A0A397I9I2_9GLOM|nr:hypothetical protein Glove_271g16 [Diversispora epigaea]
MILRTVVIIKVKGKDEILGIYNPLSLNNTKTYDGWGNTYNSFIFSFKNGNMQSKNSRSCNSELGPYFGNLVFIRFNFTLDNDYSTLPEEENDDEAEEEKVEEAKKAMNQLKVEIYEDILRKFHHVGFGLR